MKKRKNAKKKKRELMRKNKEKEKEKRHRHPLRVIERTIDLSIPILMILLAIVLILDNPFWTLIDLEHYEPQITYFDTTVISIFVVDLIFKWFHVRKALPFLRMYWIDIIAVFPFYLFFRAFIFLSEFAAAGREAQEALHEAILVRESRLLREAEFAQKAERTIKESRPLVRAIRSISRFLRLLGARVLAIHSSLLGRSSEIRKGKGSRPRKRGKRKIRTCTP